jgi:hypothetical protein
MGPRKSIDPRDCLWGKDFFETYLKHASRTSYKNKRLHQAAALSLIGQSIRNVRLRADQTFIDGRLHPFVIQSSGTGKNGAFNFMGTVAKAAGMDFDEHGKDSTAGIMGTIKRNGDKQKGDLAGSGFVAWKEAQQLIKAAQSEHSSDLMEVINQAIDPSGKVSRSLSGGDLRYHSRTSLFCTTYPPDKGNQIDLIHTGFLPRTLFMYRRKDEQFYNFVNEKRDNNLPGQSNQSNDYVDEYNEDVKKLGNTLKYINETVFDHGEVYKGSESHYAVGDTHIDYFNKVNEGVSLNPSPVFDELIQDYPFEVRKIAKPFRTRLFDTTYKIAACLAVVDKDKEHGVYVSRSIRKEHAKQAKKIVKYSCKSILDFIDDYRDVGGKESLTELENKIQEICMNDSGYAKVRELMAETNRPLKEVKRDISTLVEMNKVKVDNISPTAMEADDKVMLDKDDNIRRY